MINLVYDGSYPLNRLRPPKGCTFKQYTIRNWTPHNCRIASKRRCHYLLCQLPPVRWVASFAYRVNLAVPKEIQDIEYELRKAIGVYEIVGA